MSPVVPQGWEYFKSWRTYNQSKKWICWWVVIAIIGFPGGASGKESACQCRKHKRFRFDPWVRKISLEYEIATHSSILAWKIPRTEEPGGLQSMGSQRVRNNWAYTHQIAVSIVQNNRKKEKVEASNLTKNMIKHDNKCPFLQNTLLYVMVFLSYSILLYSLQQSFELDFISSFGRWERDGWISNLA